MFTTAKAGLIAALTMLLGGCASNGLDRLALQGPELHPALSTHLLDKDTTRHIPHDVLQHNPQYSTDPEFVNAVVRSGSQGNLTASGIRSALYALYDAQNNLGLYGLEAESAADADRIEQALRSIWADNVSLERARVYREDRLLVVVWTDGVATEVWDAVNTTVAERLLAVASNGLHH